MKHLAAISQQTKLPNHADGIIALDYWIGVIGDIVNIIGDIINVIGDAANLKNPS